MKSLSNKFNHSADVAQQIDDFIKANPRASYALVSKAVRQGGVGALKTIALPPVRPFSMSDVDAFLDENAALMASLAK